MQPSPSLLGLLAYALFAVGFIGAKPFGFTFLLITWGLCVVLLGARMIGALFAVLFR